MLPPEKQKKQQHWKSWNDVKMICEASAKARILRGDAFADEVRGIRLRSAVVIIMEEHRARQLRTSVSSEKGASHRPQRGSLYPRCGQIPTPYSRNRRAVEIISIFKVDELKKYGLSEVLGPNSTTIPVRVALKDNEFIGGFLETTFEATLVEITLSGDCRKIRNARKWKAYSQAYSRSLTYCCFWATVTFQAACVRIRFPPCILISLPPLPQSSFLACIMLP